jgi:hypothetical protein
MIPDRETLLGWLAEKAEDRGSPRDTAAIKVLLDELRRDDDDSEGESTLDALDNVTEIGSRRPQGA